MTERKVMDSIRWEGHSRDRGRLERVMDVAAAVCYTVTNLFM